MANPTRRHISNKAGRGNWSIQVCTVPYIRLLFSNLLRRRPGRPHRQGEDITNIPHRRPPGPPPPKISKQAAPPSGPSPPPPSRAQPQPQPGSAPPPESAAPAQKPPHAAAVAAGTAQPPQTAPQIPSNKAHPTLTDGRQSPNVDEHGNLRPDVPEDVKRHNRELESRYDRAYNQIAEDGKVQKGWWSQDRHFEPTVEEQENRFVRWWPRG
ncbi:hypothetical protein VTN02DRAFT_5004 [Thermoascus thermophilus]